MKFAILVPVVSLWTLVLGTSITNEARSSTYIENWSLTQCLRSCDVQECGKDFNCCHCFEYDRFQDFNGTDLAAEPTTAYQWCVHDYCMPEEIQYIALRQGLYGKAPYYCGGAHCPDLGYDPELSFMVNKENKEEEERLAKEAKIKAELEEKEARIKEHRNWALTVGLGSTLPILFAVIMGWVAYQFWWKPRRDRNKVWKSVEYDKNVPGDVDPTTGARSIPLT